MASSSDTRREQNILRETSSEQTARAVLEGQSVLPAQTEPTSRKVDGELLERVLSRENMSGALRRVQRNGGAPGVDGLTVEQLLPYLNKHWTRIKQELLNQTDRCSPETYVSL